MAQRLGKSNVQPLNGSASFSAKMKQNHLVIKCSAICMFVSLVFQNPYAVFAHRDFGGANEAAQEAAQAAGWRARTAPVQFGAQAATTPMSLDLSSTTRNLSAELLGITNSVTINLAGASRVINPGDLLTAAELVAASQMISNSAQTLRLGAGGQAVGGRVSLAAGSLQSLNELVVPQNVRFWGDFSSASALNLSGNLNNAGHIYAYTSNSGPQAASATINANNIYNQAGALLTSVLPPGATGIGSSQRLDLTLNALGDIVNAGTISSSGNLTASAGGSIVNALPQGMTVAMPVMQAANNLNLIAGSGNITNAGLMNALNGNLNLNTSSAMNLMVNNAGGMMQALNGMINMRDAGFTGNRDLSLAGGDLAAQKINLYSGQGVIRANLDDVLGPLSTYAGTAHVLASSNTLTLGEICITGDPTYFNIGSIEITGDVEVAESLAILATGNITSTSGLTQITSQNGSGVGHNIVIVAGANLTPSACGSCSPDAQPGSESSTSVTVNLNSPNGGNIDFSASSGLLIDAGSTSGSGANVTLAAFANGATGGSVILPNNSTINTSGSGANNNGNVMVLAGTDSGAGMNLGQITAGGGTGNAAGTGEVFLMTVQPSSTDGNAIVFGTNGAITSGNNFGPETDVEGLASTVYSSITMNGSIQASNSVMALAGKNLSVKDITTAGGSISLYAQGDYFTGIGGIVTLAGSMSTAGASGDSGNVLVIGATIHSATGIGSIDTSSSTGNGGSVFMTVGLPLQLDPSTQELIHAPEPMETDEIDLTLGGGLTFIDTSSSATNGSGGNVNIYLQYAGGQAREVFLPSASTITTGGNGNGANGEVQIVNGGISPTQLQTSTGDIDTTGGTGGGGSIYVLQDNNGFSGEVIFQNGVMISGEHETFGINFSIMIGLGDVSTGTLTASNADSFPPTLIFVGTGHGEISTGALTNNGIAAGAAGGSIRVAATTTLTIDGSINANGTLTGAGGTVRLTSSGGTIGVAPGTASGEGVDGTINAHGGSSSGAAGGIVELNANLVLISDYGNISYAPSVNGGDGGSLSLQGTTISVPSGTISADAVINGIGGNITIGGNSLEITGGSTLLLSANGMDAGSGGSVTISLSDSEDLTPLVIDASGISISATSGANGGDGGIVYLTNNYGDVIIDAVALSIAPQGTGGSGAELAIIAGNTSEPTIYQGNVYISNTLDVQGVGIGDGGIVTITSNSSSAFVIGSGATVNGVNGSILANSGPTGNQGGDVYIANGWTGGITLADASDLDVSVAQGTGGRIVLDALEGNLTLEAATYDVSGAGGGGWAGGSFTIRGQEIIFTGGGTFNVFADSSGAPSTGGSIEIDHYSLSPFELDFGTLSAYGGVGGDPGSINIDAHGAPLTMNIGTLLSAAPVSPFSGPGIQLNSSDFQQGEGQIIVQGPGTIEGAIMAQAAGVSIHPQGAGTQLVINQIYASKGMINLQVDGVGSGANITLQQNGQLIAEHGAITVQNNDTSAGSIVIGTSAFIVASSDTVLGQVYLVIGAPPVSPDPGTAPPGVSVTTENGGEVFFGTNSIDAGSGGHQIGADGTQVVFNTGSLPASAILLESNAIITGQAANTLPTIISNLDLTNADAVAVITNLQNLSQVGGTLVITNGVATGGNMIVSPSDLAQSIAAEYIPAGVTATFENFTASEPINIDLTSASLQKTVVIAGTHEFVSSGPASSGVLNITSYLQSTPDTLFVVTSGGSFSSDGSLTANVNSGIVIDGTVSAQDIVLQATGNDGGVTVNQSISASNSLTLGASGAGAIVQTTGTLTTATLLLTAGLGNIGSQLQTMNVNAANLSATSNGSSRVYINDVATTVSLGTSQAGIFFSLTVADDLVVAPGATVQANGNGSESESSGIKITAPGELVISAGSTVQVIADGTINFNTPSLENNGMVNAVTGDTVIHQTGNVTVLGTGTINGTVEFISDTGDVSVTQAQISGQIMGSADGQYSATVSSGTLWTGDITANDEISLINSGGGILVHDSTLLANGSGTITLTSSGCCGVMLWKDFNLSKEASITASTITINTPNLTNNGGTVTASTSLTIQSTGDLVLGDGSALSNGGGTLDSPDINLLSTNGSVIASQGNINGTVDATADENFMLYVYNTAGLTLGTFTTPYVVDSISDPMGGTTYYAANSVEVIDDGGLLVLSSGNALSAVAIGTITDHVIDGTLTITNGNGALAIHLGTTLTASNGITITNNGSGLVIDGGAFNADSSFSFLTSSMAMNITNASGDLTVNSGTYLQTQNPSYAMEIDNQSGNFVANSGSRAVALGDMTLTNNGGTMSFGPQSVAQGQTGDGIFSNTGGDIIALNSVLNGENLQIDNSGGSIIFDHQTIAAGFINADITNTNGNIVFDNQSQIYAQNNDLTITKAGTGNVLFNNGANVNSMIASMTLTMTGAGNLEITNEARIGAATELTIENVAGNMLFSNNMQTQSVNTLTITNNSGNTAFTNGADVYSNQATTVTNSNGTVSLTTSAFLAGFDSLAVTSTNGAVAVDTSAFDGNSGIVWGQNTLTINADQNISIIGNGNNSEAVVSSGGVELNSAGGAVFVRQQHMNSRLLGSAYTNFSAIIENSDLEVGDIAVNDSGANASSSLTLTVRSYGADITVANGAALSVKQGDLMVQGYDLTFEQDSSLTAQSTSANSGRVYLIAGAFPNDPAEGGPPSNMIVNNTGGEVYWGTNIIAADPPDNTVNVTNSTVVVYNMLNPEVECCTSITFGGGVVVNASSSVAPSGPIVSLDLTNLTVTNLLLSLQLSSDIGGTLIVEGGVATGGNVIIGPSLLAASLTAANVPAGVVVTLQGFSALSPVNINITGTSTTLQVIVGGTLEFTAGSGTIDIASNQAGPVLVVESTGLLTSDGTLTVNANGSMALAGNVSANTSVTLAVTGTSTITRTGGTITSPAVSLSSGTGSIGTGANPIVTATSTLALTTAGSANAFVTNSGVVNLAASSVAGTLQVLNNNTITTTGVVSAGTLKLQTTANNGNIVIGSNATSALSSNLTTQGTGTVTINSTRTLAATNGNVNIIANGINIQGAINSGTKSTQLRPNATVAITVGNTGASSDPFEVSAAELARITAGTLLVGDFGKNSTFTLADDIDVSGAGPAGVYSLVFVTGGSYTPSPGATITLGATRSLSVSAQGNVSTGSVTGSTFVNFSSAQTITVNGDVTVSGGTLQITGNTLNITGTVNVGSGTVQFAPYGNRTIAIGGSGGSAQFELTNAFLANITANSLTLGQAYTPGGITVVAGTDLSSTNVSQYNLQNGGNITNAGSLTLGLKTLVMSAQGTLTSGSIFGGTLVSLQAQGTLTVNGAVSLTAGTVNLQGATVAFSGGSVNAGQGIVYLRPTSDVSIGVGDSGGSAAFKVTDSMLSNITAAALAIGDLGLVGGLTVEGDLDISSNYNLYLLNGGAMSNAGHTIVVGSRTLGVQSGSTLSTGTVTATGGQVTLLAAGTLTVDGAVTNTGLGSTTISTTAGSNGNIVLDAAVGGGSFTTISANGSGSLSQSTGSISGTNVVLSSGTGSLGTSSAPLAVTANTLRANTQGSGTVFVDATSSSLTLGTSSAGGDFSVTSSGALTVGTIATLNGDITLVASSGALNVQANKTIFANEGNLVLQNTDTAAGTIAIGLNSELEAYTTGNPVKGFVTIFIGTTTPTPTNTTAPANVDINSTGGGTAYFGANSIVALKPGVDDNIVNVIGRDVVFDTGSRPASAITLMGNNIITADPPEQPVVIISSNQQETGTLTLTSGVNLTPTSGVTPSSSGGTIINASGNTSTSSNSGSSSVEAVLTVKPTENSSIEAGTVSVTTNSSGINISNLTNNSNSVTLSGGHNLTILANGTIADTASLSASSGTINISTSAGTSGALTVTNPNTSNMLSQSSSGPVGGRQARNNSSTSSSTTTTATTGGRNARNTSTTSGSTSTITTTTTTTTSGGRNARLNNTTTGGSAPLSSPTNTNTGSATGRKARQSNLPVAFTPVTTTSGIQMMNIGTALVEYTAAAQIQASEVGIISLNSGEALVMASDDTTLNIFEHQILVKAGTIALVSHEDGVTKVRNLYEQSAGSNGLQALVANQSIGASAGEEIIVSPDAEMLLNSIKKDSVGRRMLHSANAGDLKVATCEISLVSLTPSTDLLPAIFHSKHKIDRAIAEKLIKMAACLSSATAGHGAYTPVTGHLLP